MATVTDQQNRPHRPSKEKKRHTSDQNPKAFAHAKPFAFAKRAVRSQELREKRFHVPQVDRLPADPPPTIVGVVGPPGVGKTTLIKSLIRRYTKQTLTSPSGPLTLVTSKRKRLTIIECPSDSLAAMVDLSKIVDVVLLMIDGNFGFEMETMEFLNILSSSGMPGNVFGVLTHLDLFRKPSTLRDTKKRLKHRFWNELYQGAKLFYLSGVINGRYPDREIHNLSRFISVMKNPRPLVWRNSHPYCLADRMLDVTAPTEVEKNSKCDRTIALYGYLRGTNFSARSSQVHIPGVGDLTVSGVEALTDPCPTPFMDQEIAKITGKSGRRRLGEKQKILFAPMSDVGGVLVDKDAVYIDVKTSTFDKLANNDEERGLGEQLVVDLQNERRLLGHASNGVRLFAGAKALSSNVADDEAKDTGRKTPRNFNKIQQDVGDETNNFSEDVLGSSSSEDEDPEQYTREHVSQEKLGRAFSQPGHDSKDPSGQEAVQFADSDSDIGSLSSVEGQEFDSEGDSIAFPEDEDEDEDTAIDFQWKENIGIGLANATHNRRSFRPADLSRLMYDDQLSPAQVVQKWAGQRPEKSDQDSDVPKPRDQEDDFFLKSKRAEIDDDEEERAIPQYDVDALARKWSNTEMLGKVKARFTSIDTRSRSTGRVGGAGDNDDETSVAGDSGDEGDGDFVDLEASEPAEDGTTADASASLETERAKNARKKEEFKLRFEQEDRDGFGKSQDPQADDAGDEDQFGEDDWYAAQKAQIQKQLSINRAELDQMDDDARIQVEGLKAGTYARIVLEDVPCEFVETFHPSRPVIVGGLAPTETRFGFVSVRMKRHRWHKKILKTNDPLIFSLGWRRFQSLPIYSTSDSRTRNRMLKYTPEHMHCFGTVYAPLIAPNTGFCCFQSLSSQTPNFRVAATGVVLNVDESTEIVKKLKLTGQPYKIFRNTAFVRDMFTSALEIAKFEGASIRTVSGIRGQIKKALSKPEGHYRATFEDKILMSDIVFLRAWYPIRPHRFYNPITNLLDDTPRPLHSSEAFALQEPHVDGGIDGDTSEVRVGHQNNQSINEAPTQDTPSRQTAPTSAMMRLTGEIRAANAIPTPQDKNSQYRPIDRPTRQFNPLRVPKTLAANLPYKSQIATMLPQRKQTYLQKRAVVLGGEERKIRELMQQLTTVQKDRDERRKLKQEERKEPYRRRMRENLEKKASREKREQDEYWRREGKKRKAGDQSIQKKTKKR